MSRLLKSVDELPLKLLTDAIAATAVSLPLPTGIPQTTSLGGVIPLVQPSAHPAAPVPHTDDGWHHGGINE